MNKPSLSFEIKKVHCIAKTYCTFQNCKLCLLKLSSKKHYIYFFLEKSSNFVSSRTHLQHYQLIIGSLPNSDNCHETLTKHLNVLKYSLDTSTPCCFYRSCTFQTSGNFLKALKRNHSHTSPFPEQKLEIFIYIISTLLRANK